MMHLRHKRRTGCSFGAHVKSIVSCAVFALVLLAVAAPAFAGFENLEPPFALKGTEGELGNNAGGMAVNETSGNVYVADGAHSRVTVFDSHGVFIEAWGWGVATPGIEAFQRCGPKLSPCMGSEGGEGVGEFSEPFGVAVDQTTGDVFVLDGHRKNNVVQVFSSNGTFLFGFGEHGGQKNEPVALTPALIRTASKSGIAVDQATGNVYVVDRNSSVPKEARVLVFKRVSPLVYEYERELFTGLEAEKVGLTSSGDVYVLAKARVLYRFAAGSVTTPVWEHEEAKDIEGMTVNSETGDVIYYTSQTHRYHELALSTGKQFAEWEGVEKEKLKEIETEGLAFNSKLTWEECVKQAGGMFADGTCSGEGSPNEFEKLARPKGVLYAIDPNLIEGLIFAEPPLLKPTVGSAWVSYVGTGSALIHAEVNPHGFDTRYSVQYGTEDCFAHPCTSTAPFPAAGDAGSGGKDVSVSVPVNDLTPGTTYYFRVVASSHCKPLVPAEVCSAEFPADPPAGAFSTFSASPAGLADERVYELVSPPMKDGGNAFPLSPSNANCSLCMPGVNKVHFPMQSTIDGSAMAYEGDPFTTEGGAVAENEYLSQRGADGWLAPRDLSPAAATKETEGGAGVKGLSSDLTRGVLYQIGSSLAGAPPGYSDLYLEQAGDGSLEPLVAEEPVNRTTAEFRLAFAGGSSDLSHVVFEANGALPTDSATSAPVGSADENDLYEWVNGSLRLVNVLPDETAEPHAIVGGSEGALSHAVSEDGSRIFWTDLNNAHGHAGHVYVRVNGESTQEVPDGEGGSFLTASADGMRVLLSDGRIYDLSGAVPAEEGDLTGGHHGFQGILGASKDLSTVYFVDTAVLTGSEKNGEEAEAVAGKDNLYVFREGAVKFVATLASADNGTDINHGELPGNTGDWAAPPSERTAQATTDGRYLTFMSQADLTKSASGSAGLFEVYEFNADTNDLVCVSCNPTGERPLGPSQLGVIHPGSGFLPQPTDVSMNGRVFFNSLDQLSPNDTNGDFEDVYEYEPDGVGSCALQAGCVFLISSGREETNSSFVNATPSGSDVFFATRAQLVPQDGDDLMDLYDARVSGSSPPPPPPPPCEGDTCRGRSSSPPPVLSMSLSSTIVGDGNVVFSSSPPPPSPPVFVPLTRAHKLAKALSACRKARTSRKKRLACEKHARKVYGFTKSKTGGK